MMAGTLARRMAHMIMMERDVSCVVIGTSFVLGDAREGGEAVGRDFLCCSQFDQIWN